MQSCRDFNLNSMDSLRHDVHANSRSTRSCHRAATHATRSQQTIYVAVQVGYGAATAQKRQRCCTLIYKGGRWA